MSDSTIPFPLLRLPTELRLSILDYILPRDTSHRKTITLYLRKGLRYYNLANLHINETTPSRHALSRYLKGIGAANRQLRADALTLLYARTFVICIDEEFLPTEFDSRNWWNYAHHYCKNGWRAFLPGLDLARIKELRILVEPSDCPGKWDGIHQRMNSFCRMLGRSICKQGLKRLVVEITQTKESKSVFGDQRQDGWDPEDPEEATIEDIVGVLDPACRFVRHVRACRVEVPEWANKDQKVRNAVKETTTAVCLQSAANVEDEEETEWSDEELEAEERNSSETPCKCDDCRVERGTKDVEIRHREHTTEEIWDDGAWRLNTWEPRQKQLWERSIDEKWDSFYALPPLM